MTNKRNRFVISLSLLVLLTGCMYPEERDPGNQIPPGQMVEQVQQAIDRYYEEEHILPIQTKPKDTPIFEKYVIQFQKLVPKYLPSPPPNVFEEGGSYYYVLVNAEENPTVKLLDLKVTSRVADVQSRVNVYVRTKGNLPVKEEIGSGYYSIDFDALKLEEQTVKSVYSGEYLPLIMNRDGQIGVDYRIDLYRLLGQMEQLPEKGTDIRKILVDQSIYVPVKSFPYTIENGEPVLIPEEK